MEFESSNVYSPCLYKTAPNSPNGYNRSNSNSNSNSMDFYYSAPVSPRRATFKTGDGDDDDDDQGSGFDEFEFETSKRFSRQLQSEASESPVSGDGGRSGRGRGKHHRERGDSLPAMAFADELFLNGLVMPLKPPPGVQSDSEFSSFGRRSPLSSPKSPRTVCRIPFAQKSSWNDDFDPFVAALEKVREEKRGRNSHHRRSRSYSPFRAMPKKSSSETDDCPGQDFSNGNSLAEPMPSPSYSGPLDFKGSAYARWVRDQTRHGLSTKSPRRFLFRQRVRPLKTEQDVSAPLTGTQAGKKCGNAEVSPVQKLKGLLVRYASFGRGNSRSKQTQTSSETQKMSYFGRVSFKFKGNAHSSNSKKKIPADTNMAVVRAVQYKPSIAFCLGYGLGSPIKAK